MRKKRSGSAFVQIRRNKRVFTSDTEYIPEMDKVNADIFCCRSAKPTTMESVDEAVQAAKAQKQKSQFRFITGNTKVRKRIPKNLKNGGKICASDRFMTDRYLYFGNWTLKNSALTWEVRKKTIAGIYGSCAIIQQICNLTSIHDECAFI
jgi:hypothetical protein